MIHFGCNIQVERYLKATQNFIEYSDFLQWIRNCGDVWKDTRTILRCFFFKMTELRMKNLAVQGLQICQTVFTIWCDINYWLSSMSPLVVSSYFSVWSSRPVNDIESILVESINKMTRFLFLKIVFPHYLDCFKIKQLPCHTVDCFTICCIKKTEVEPCGM